MQLDLFKDETEDVAEEAWTKCCSICGERYPETEEYFYKSVLRQDKHGNTKQYYDSRCISCHNKGTRVVHHLKKKHGHKAKGSCDCCGKDASELRGGILYLDHCHETGEYRGHICDSCNKAIGLLGDTSTGVQKALEYLQRVEKKE